MLHFIMIFKLFWYTHSIMKIGLSGLIAKDGKEEMICQTCFLHTVYFVTAAGFSPNSPSVNFSATEIALDC